MPPRGGGGAGAKRGSSPDFSGENEVLRGPRRPFWSCGCGEADNFASRIACRSCLRDAPRSILNKARAAHERALATSGARGTAREGRGRRGNEKEKDSDKKTSALEELRKQIRELKLAVAATESAKTSSTTAPEGDDEAMGDCETSLDDLVASLAALTKSLGPEDPATVLVAARVREARQRRDADKPLAAKVRTVVGRRDKAQTQLDKATAAEAKARAKLEEAQLEVTRAIDATQQARLALAQDEAVLADLQNALAQETSCRAKEAGYRAPPATAHELLAPAAAALLASCQDPMLAEALKYVAAKHQEAVNQERRAVGGGSGKDGLDDEALRVLLETRQRDSAARAALAQLRARAGGDAGAVVLALGDGPTGEGRKIKHGGRGRGSGARGQRERSRSASGRGG